MHFNEYVRCAREKMDISQENASKLIEKQYGVRLSPSYLSMIESGQRTNLTVDLIKALIEFYNLPLSTIKSLFEMVGGIKW
jgi:transcriptional regulator with XRE-family HTH domain